MMVHIEVDARSAIPNATERIQTGLSVAEIALAVHPRHA